ncbi:MAG: helix-turn-helix domain-containing protein [Ilumatobacteraceae bacterium]
MPTEASSRHLIRMARQRAGLSQMTLATRARTSQPAVSAYESGRRSPSVETLTRLLVASGFELRMRLAKPDTHDAARFAAEKLIDPRELAEHTKREKARIKRLG